MTETDVDFPTLMDVENRERLRRRAESAGGKLQAALDADPDRRQQREARRAAQLKARKGWPRET